MRKSADKFSCPADRKVCGDFLTNSGCMTRMVDRQILLFFTLHLVDEVLCFPYSGGNFWQWGNFYD